MRRMRLEELLIEGLDDWVPVHNVVWHARELADGKEAEVPSLVRWFLTAVIGRRPWSCTRPLATTTRM